MKHLLILAACTTAIASSSAIADEDAIQLRDGVGLDSVQAYCSTCHSLDYIPMNSPFLDEKGWEGEVNKMINVFGAPIPEPDAAAIHAYLTSQYGKQ